MIEKYLIDYCSPTLASLKTANLINIPCEHGKQLEDSIDGLNRCLRQKGVSLMILKKTEKSALVYIYRKKNLQKDLKKDGVANFMKQYGYLNSDADYCISRLKKRLAQTSSFPHEIGIFLGYPLEDVKGFITNGGQNCKLGGCWKVYCNETQAQKTFDRFNKCKKVYKKLWLQGRSIIKLTVAA